MIIIALLAVAYLLVAAPVLAVVVGRMIKTENKPHITDVPVASSLDSWER